MRFRLNTNPWRRRFAVLPLFLRGEVVWLEWYWRRDCGLYTEISLSEPQWPPEGYIDTPDGLIGSNAQGRG